MTTTQMLLQVGNAPVQDTSSKQYHQTENALRVESKEKNAPFQSMLEEKRDQMEQVPTQQPGNPLEVTTMEQIQSLMAVLFQPVQGQLPQEERVFQVAPQNFGWGTSEACVPVNSGVTSPQSTGAFSGDPILRQGQILQPQTNQPSTDRMTPGTEATANAGLFRPLEIRQSRPQTIQAPHGSEGKVQQPDLRRSENALRQKVPLEGEIIQTQTLPTGEQPVFREVEVMPVKVGESAPLDTTSEEFDARTARVLANALQRGERTVELKLFPAHLGTVSVELTQTTDGILHVVMTAEKEHTLKLLAEHAGYLGHLLQNSTHQEVRIEVPQSQQGQQQPEQQESHGQQQGGSQRQRRENQSEQESFLQQLRLGLLHSESL